MIRGFIILIAFGFSFFFDPHDRDWTYYVLYFMLWIFGIWNFLHLVNGKDIWGYTEEKVEPTGPAKDSRLKAVFECKTCKSLQIFICNDSGNWICQGHEKNRFTMYKKNSYPQLVRRPR